MGNDAYGPKHNVTLTNDFYIGVYETTQAQWQAVMGKNPSQYQGNDLPIHAIAKSECRDFIQKINSENSAYFILPSDGRKVYVKFRLPTEAEWEYACRAGTETNYFWGDSESSLNDYAWTPYNSGMRPQAIGQKLPNPWGLFDMTGNCRELCEDIYNSYSANDQADPINGVPSNGEDILRGGGWSDWRTNSFWSAYRQNVRSPWPAPDISFRLAMNSSWFDQPPDPTPTWTPTFTPKPIVSITLPLALSADVVPLNLIQVQAGHFIMGNNRVDNLNYEQEVPQHEVILTNDFYLGTYEITQAQWKAVMGNTQGVTLNNPDKPITNITWDQCSQFIAALNQMNETQWNRKYGTFDLPTEAEWEYACRAGTQTEFFWGDDDKNYFQYDYSNQKGNTSKQVV